jgi:nucleoside-diphosphate-sugar epimerase
MLKILLLGKNGQVGWELQRSLAPLGEVLALDRYSTSHCGDLWLCGDPILISWYLVKICMMLACLLLLADQRDASCWLHAGLLVALACYYFLLAAPHSLSLSLS